MKPERTQAKPQPPKPDKPHEVKEAGKQWDGVDEAGWESFPASDPPARWAGNDTPPTLNGEPEPDADENP